MQRGLVLSLQGIISRVVCTYITDLGRWFIPDLNSIEELFLRLINSPIHLGCMASRLCLLCNQAALHFPRQVGAISAS